MVRRAIGKHSLGSVECYSMLLTLHVFNDALAEPVEKVVYPFTGDGAIVDYSVHLRTLAGKQP